MEEDDADGSSDSSCGSDGSTFQRGPAAHKLPRLLRRWKPEPLSDSYRMVHSTSGDMDPETIGRSQGHVCAAELRSDDLARAARSPGSLLGLDGAGPTILVPSEQTLRLTPTAQVREMFNCVRAAFRDQVRPQLERELRQWPSATLDVAPIPVQLQRRFLRQLVAEGGLDDLELGFHGTRASALQKILRTGFRMPRLDQVAHGSLHGRGIYTTKSARYSLWYSGQHGSSRLLVCAVIRPNRSLLTRSRSAEHDELRKGGGTPRRGRGRGGSGAISSLPMGSEEGFRVRVLSSDAARRTEEALRRSRASYGVPLRSRSSCAPAIFRPSLAATRGLVSDDVTDRMDGPQSPRNDMYFCSRSVRVRHENRGQSVAAHQRERRFPKGSRFWGSAGDRPTHVFRAPNPEGLPVLPKFDRLYCHNRTYDVLVSYTPSYVMPLFIVRCNPEKESAGPGWRSGSQAPLLRTPTVAEAFACRTATRRMARARRKERKRKTVDRTRDLMGAAAACADA